jgi:hypothetical protein
MGELKPHSYPTSMEVGKEGISNVNKTVCRGNGLSSLFPINLQVFEMK